MLDKLKKGVDIIKAVVLYILTPLTAIVGGILFYLSRTNAGRAELELKRQKEEQARRDEQAKIDEATKKSYDRVMQYNDFKRRMRERDKNKKR